MMAKLRFWHVSYHHHPICDDFVLEATSDAAARQIASELYCCPAGEFEVRPTRDRVMAGMTMAIAGRLCTEDGRRLLARAEARTAERIARLNHA